MKYFSQIKQKIYLPNLDFYKNGKSYGYGLGNIVFFKNKTPDYLQEQLISIIPKDIFKYFSIELMVISSNFIMPHTDSDRKASINFYIKTNNEHTVFFNKKTDVEDKEKVKRQTNGFVYKLNDLIPFEEFIATDGDVFILDTTRIHAVIGSNKKSNLERIALTCSTNDLTFSEVVEILKDKINTI